MVARVPRVSGADSNDVHRPGCASRPPLALETGPVASQILEREQGEQSELPSAELGALGNGREPKIL